MTVEITSPDKVIYPEAGFTKRDLVEHYIAVAPMMVRHVAGRPLTLQRFPNGIGSAGFMQKNASKHFPDFVGRVEVPKNDGTTIYPLVDTVEGIAYLANQGTITFHVWTSRVPDLGHADRFVIDLDPDEGDWSAAQDAAQLVGALFDDLGITSTPMTTGSKGYHIYAKIEPTVPAPDIGLVARQIAHLAAHADPDILTTEFRKENRNGRVFVDWLRNQPGSTGVAPWSLRPRAGAPVAVPITWEELATTSPDAWHLDTVQQRTGLDPIASLPVVDLEPLVDEVAQRIRDAGIELTTFDRFRS